MLQSLLNAWKLPDLRKKLLFTALIIAIYRLGCYIPVPGIDVESINEMFDTGGVFDFYDLFTGGGLQRVAIFAMGIMPYITASIIMQLLTMVSPRLEALMKEGPAGQKKVNQYTRYFTVVLALIEAVGFVFLFKSYGAFPATRALTAAPLLPDRPDAHRRHRPGHVAGRADHPAGHRQRHLAHDLRQHRVAAPERSAEAVHHEPGLSGWPWPSSPCWWWRPSST